MEYFIAFIIGGFLIAGTKYISDQSGLESYASLIGGMPIGILASFFLKNDNLKRIYYEGFMFNQFILFGTILAIYLFILIWKDPNVNMVSISGLILWFILSVLLITLIKRS